MMAATTGGKIPPAYKPGDRIRADDENRRNAEVARLGRITGGPGLIVRDGAGGPQVAVVRPEQIYIRLTATASGGAYPWVEVWHASPHAWTVGDRTGSVADDPAYPLDGDVDLPGDDTVYEAKRSKTSGHWIFF